MKKKKWMMRWQASLMPDPLMIPDVTVFRQALHHKTPTAKAMEQEQPSQSPSSTYTQIAKGKKWKKSKKIELQLPVVTEQTVSPVEGMLAELDPSCMSVLQAEENKLTEWQILLDGE